MNTDYGHERTARAAEALSALRADLAHLADLRGTGPVRRLTGWGPSTEQLAAAGARHAGWRAPERDRYSRDRCPTHNNRKKTR